MIDPSSVLARACLMLMFLGIATAPSTNPPAPPRRLPPQVVVLHPAQAATLVQPLPQPTGLQMAIVAVVDTPTPAPPAPPVVTQPKGDAETLLHAATVAAWGESQWPAMRLVELSEAGFHPYAVNPGSGACGLPQALPCSKLLAVVGSLDNVAGQADWMVGYVRASYGTPAAAWQHELDVHWY